MDFVSVADSAKLYAVAGPVCRGIATFPESPAMICTPALNISILFRNNSMILGINVVGTSAPPWPKLVALLSRRIRSPPPRIFASGGTIKPSIAIPECRFNIALCASPSNPSGTVEFRLMHD